MLINTNIERYIHIEYNLIFSRLSLSHLSLGSTFVL